MIDFIDDPPFVRDLFDFVLEMALRFGKAQVEAGADLIGVGDAAASLVGPQMYEEFVLPYEKRLVDGLHAMGVKVRLHICGNIRRILPGIATLGCDMVDIDWMVPMEQARRRTRAAAGVGRQHRSGGGAPQRHAGEGDRGDRPLSPVRRRRVYRRGRLRGLPRHAGGERRRPARLRRTAA